MFFWRVYHEQDQFRGSDRHVERDIRWNKFYDANSSEIEQVDRTVLVYHRLDRILGDSEEDSTGVAWTVVRQSSKHTQVEPRAEQVQQNRDKNRKTKSSKLSDALAIESQTRGVTWVSVKGARSN